MARDINKIISEYDTIVTEDKEPFTLGDIQAIYNKSLEGDYPAYNTIDNALKFAFVIGYKEAQKAHSN